MLRYRWSTKNASALCLFTLGLLTCASATDPASQLARLELHALREADVPEWRHASMTTGLYPFGHDEASNRAALRQRLQSLTSFDGSSSRHLPPLNPRRGTAVISPAGDVTAKYLVELAGTRPNEALKLLHTSPLAAQPPNTRPVPAHNVHQPVAKPKTPRDVRSRPARSENVTDRNGIMINWRGRDANLPWNQEIQRALEWHRDNHMPDLRKFTVRATSDMKQLFLCTWC